MLKYECAVVFLPSPADEETPKQVETVKGWLAAIGAEVSDVDVWGRKRLAYPIRKQLEGMYVIFYFDLVDGKRLRELERRFKTAEFILRHLLVRLPALKELPRIPREEPAAAAQEEAGEPETAEGEEAEATESAEPETEIELEAETPKPEVPAESEGGEKTLEPEPATAEARPDAEEMAGEQPAAEPNVEEAPAEEPKAEEQPAAETSGEEATLETGEPKEKA